MFDKYSYEQKIRILNVLKQIRHDGKSVFDVLYDSEYLLKYLSISDYMMLNKMIIEYIDSRPDELKKYLDENPELKEKYRVNDHNFNKIFIPVVYKRESKLEWEEITPYKVLGIEERDYTKDELLQILRKKINFIKIKKISNTKMYEEIDNVLDAYNDITKTYKKKR